MRVIAGTARSMPLKCIEGLDTRPTTDRIKETLFNMLQPEIPGCRFLDLFGGSGAIGIEALSRGADYAAFAENNRKAYDCIGDNLAFTKLADRARVFFMDALGALRVLEGEEPFDIIFLDPPYGKGLEREVLSYLLDSSLLTEDTTIILEAALNEETDWIEIWAIISVR
ncbi:MAG: 16S rRNA (guanine(966)-N(2))-methyltransferase RsmD [Eubacteriales bacterium]